MRAGRLLVSVISTVVALGGLSLAGAAPAVAAEQSLGTPFTQGLTYAWEFTFDADVTPARGLDVAAVGVNAFHPVSGYEIEVLTRTGSAVGHGSSAEGWTSRGTATFTGAGRGQVTRVPIAFHLPQGVTGVKVVHLTRSADERELLGSQPGPVSNDDVTLTSRSLSQHGVTFTNHGGEFSLFYEALIPLTTQILTGPSGSTTNGDPTFTYSGGPAGEVDHFECDLSPIEPGGTAGWSTCPNTGVSYTDLPDGPYTFSVRSVDAAGGTDANPATRDFVVDTPPPTITAAITSGTAPNAAGWYRTPVTITYTCDGAGSTLTTDCPAPRTLWLGGAERTVTRHIATTDGDTATSVTTVSIDRARPRLRVAGFNPDRTYTSRPTIECNATDKISGVRTCRAVARINEARTRVIVRARAVDNAGNVRARKLSAPYRDR